MVKDAGIAGYLDTMMSNIDFTHYWIGLTMNESSWYWDDGSALENDRWQFSEPSGDGPCVAAIKPWNFKWNDIFCTAEYYFICEA